MVVQQEEANAIGKKAEGWKGGRAGGQRVLFQLSKPQEDQARRQVVLRTWN